MLGRTPTAAESRWLSLIAQIPCIVCLYHYGQDTPAEIHHLDGSRKPQAHLKTIPLCPNHHRHKDAQKPPRWISRHGDGATAFKRAYGDDSALLAYTQAQVEKLQGRQV